VDNELSLIGHYYKSWFFKRFKLINLSFWLMDMYILTKGLGLEWHMYVLINQFDYNGLFDYIQIIKL
jgi:hypothetical protein